MNAAILCIGDELLIGQVINTNAAWIGKQLSSLGFRTIMSNVVPDELPAILQAFDNCATNARLVIVTGGLGPTRDDKTRDAITQYFQTTFRTNQEVLDDIRHFIALRNGVMNELNTRQALVPIKATILRNPVGTAPGLWLENNRATFVFLPGVPFEMKRIFNEQLVPRIEDLTSERIFSKTFLAEGIAESALAEILASFEDALPKNFSLAYLPSPGLVRLRLTLKGPGNIEMQDSFNAMADKLFTAAAPYIYGSDDETTQKQIVNRLNMQNKTLGIAESCTGGRIASLITQVPGCSSVFKGGIVAYHNEIKTALLGVPETILSQFGAVSQQVVEAMATGCRARIGTDYAIAVSGIAGPGGGSAEKPVGTVWIAIATPTSVFSKKHFFGEEREYTMERAAVTALGMLRKVLT